METLRTDMTFACHYRTAAVGYLLVCSWWLLCLSSSLICAAEIPPSSITFPPRPRVAFTSSEIEAWRSDAGRLSTGRQSTNRLEERRQIIDRADQFLRQELYVPTQEGNWVFYYACPKDAASLQAKSLTEHVCPVCGAIYTDERTNAAYRTILNNRLEHSLYDLAVAYALTQDDKYVVPVREALLKWAKAFPTLERHDRWGRRGLLAVVGGKRYAQHLDEAVSAILLAKVYDLVVDSKVFSATDRQTIEQSFLGATVREIQKYQLFVDPKGLNNHITWFNAAYANVGLALGDESLMRDAVYGKHGLLYQLQSSVTDDGLWYEGTIAYHFYALSAIQETLSALRRVGWDLSRNPRLKSLYQGPIQMAYPDGSFPVINDSDPAQLGNYAAFYRFAADYFKDPTFEPHANPSSGGAFIRQQPKSAAMKSSGLVALRRGSGAGAVCAMIDYGIHGGHHGHPDKLNLVLYALGREVVLDVGRITYSVPEYETWARTTVAHNTVVLDRKNQEATEGQLLDFRNTKDYAECLCVSKGAYPGFTLKRCLVLGDAWLVDVLAVSGDHSVTMDWLLHARGDLAPGLAGGRELTGKPLPTGALGRDNGYQHLTDLKEWECSESPVLRFAQPDGKVLSVHCLESVPTSIYTGNGIGHNLGDRVPFVLRRREAAETCFVTVYDLSGAGDAISGVQSQPLDLRGRRKATVEGSRVRFGIRGTTQELRLDLRESPGKEAIQRVRYRKAVKR
ncbi:MAG: heparinase II/III family protein [Armatimonadetes bacterium]|nr:heparinase II/III family protein [Armatimonadota bacterium]